MFERSKWCRMLALNAFRGLPEKRLISVPAMRVLDDHSQEESDGRQRQCMRTCSGRWQPSTPERSSTPPASHVPDVDFRAFAKHAQNVFCSLRCFACPHIDVGSKNAHDASSLLFPASAPLALRTSTCTERRQVSCCGTQLNVAKLLIRRREFKRMSLTGISNLETTAHVFAQIANITRCLWCFTLLMNLHDFVIEPFNPVHIFRDAHTVPCCLTADHISTCLMSLSAPIKPAQFWSVLDTW